VAADALARAFMRNGAEILVLDERPPRWTPRPRHVSPFPLAHREQDLVLIRTASPCATLIDRRFDLQQFASRACTTSL
jgi:hypothetical protein